MHELPGPFDEYQTPFFMVITFLMFSLIITKIKLRHSKKKKTNNLKYLNNCDNICTMVYKKYNSILARLCSTLTYL